MFKISNTLNCHIYNNKFLNVVLEKDGEDQLDQ
jgi:hypothetical protein